MTNDIYTKQPGYLYCCIHPETKEHYIGVRLANKKPPIEDFGHVYRTSSKIVKPRFDEFENSILFESYDYDGLYQLEQMLIHSCFLANKQILLNKMFIDVTKSDGYQKYNSVGRSSVKKGKQNSEETRKKISESNKGRNPWNRGITHTDETKQKLKIASTGRKHSEETKQKMSEDRKGHISWNKGLTKESDNRVLKISNSNKGNPGTFTGKHHTDETKAKISMKNTGRRYSDEVNAKKGHHGEKNCNYGKPQPLDRKLKNIESNKNRPRIECPHCKGKFQKGMFNRWHGDKCKMNIV